MSAKERRPQLQDWFINDRGQYEGRIYFHPNLPDGIRFAASVESLECGRFDLGDPYDDEWGADWDWPNYTNEEAQ